jgi:hypothetical protein
MYIANLANQHDALKIFLNVVLLGGDLTQLERRDLGRFPIDILDGLTGYELKTKQSTSFDDIPLYIKEYYANMVKFKHTKKYWWLIFFQERKDAKEEISEMCKFYLVTIEINTELLTADKQDYLKLTQEVMELVQKLKEKVEKKDEMENGIFAPVDNFIVVERLRKKIKQKDQEKELIINQKDQEKALIIKQKDQEKELIINQKDQEKALIIKQKDQEKELIINQKNHENELLKKEKEIVEKEKQKLEAELKKLKEK